MNDEQASAFLIEFQRITRGLREAIRLITSQQAEIKALREILVRKGWMSEDELDAQRDEILSQVKPQDPASQHGIDLPQLDLVDEKWKM